MRNASEGALPVEWRGTPERDVVDEGVCREKFPLCCTSVSCSSSLPCCCCSDSRTVNDTSTTGSSAGEAAPTLPKRAGAVEDGRNSLSVPQAWRETREVQQARAGSEHHPGISVPRSEPGHPLEGRKGFPEVTGPVS